MENALYLAIGAAATAFFGLVRDTVGFKRRIVDQLTQQRIDAYRAFATQANHFERVTRDGGEDPGEVERELDRRHHDLAVVASPATLDAAVAVVAAARRIIEATGDGEAARRPYLAAQAAFLERARTEITRGH
jgi:hypothetical protein